MGSPDSSIDEKMAELDAFMSQKIRDIETKKIQLQGGGSIDSASSSDDELRARLGL